MVDAFHRARSWEIDRERSVLKIDWDDGAVAEYGFEPMRRACPCAYCSGEGTFAGNVNAETIFTQNQTDLKEVYPVGRYGIAPEWGDGHSTGIYTFKMLRQAAGLA